MSHPRKKVEIAGIHGRGNIFGNSNIPVITFLHPTITSYRFCYSISIQAYVNQVETSIQT